MEKCYIQLYSLREEASKDFVGTLKRVAEIGYTGIEFAGGLYGDLSAAELKRTMTDLSLEALSTHIVTKQAPNHLEYASELGLRYLMDPFATMSTYEDALAFSEQLNKVGKLYREKGIAFGYHNHRHEFLEGKDGYLLETMMLNTDPENVCFQLDVGWAACAGVDVPAFLRKYPGRIKLIHVKESSIVAGAEKLVDFSKFPVDEKGSPQIPPEITKKFEEQNKWNIALGQGIVDWHAVRDASLSTGVDAFIIEREYNYANDIFKCVEEDYAFLRSL